MWLWCSFFTLKWMHFLLYCSARHRNSSELALFLWLFSALSGQIFTSIFICTGLTYSLCELFKRETELQEINIFFLISTALWTLTPIHCPHVKWWPLRASQETVQSAGAKGIRSSADYSREQKKKRCTVLSTNTVQYKLRLHCCLSSFTMSCRAIQLHMWWELMSRLGFKLPVYPHWKYDLVVF